MKCLIGVHLKTLLSIWNHLKASPFHPTMTSGEGTSTSLSTSSQVAAFCDSSDDDFLGIDLMNLDFTVSSALSDWNVNKNEKASFTMDFQVAVGKARIALTAMKHFLVKNSLKVF